jgi:hypothetical protein
MPPTPQRTAYLPEDDPAPVGHALSPEAHALLNHAGLPGVGGGGPGGATQQEQVFTPTLGQTVFTLATTPTYPDDTGLFINTVKYIYGTNFNVVGNTVVWLNFPFSLDSFDVVEVIYFV